MYIYLYLSVSLITWRHVSFIGSHPALGDLRPEIRDKDGGGSDVYSGDGEGDGGGDSNGDGGGGCWGDS